MKEEQYTIGKLIEVLKQIPKGESERVVRFNFEGVIPTDFGSWRGDYSELALGFKAQDWGIASVQFGDFLKALEETIGQTYEGWKGGDFTMHADTRLWVSNRGNNDHNGICGVEHTEYEVILLVKQFDY